MPDDFDSVVADRCSAVDDVPVPADLWSRVQFRVLDRLPAQVTEEETTIIGVSWTDASPGFDGIVDRVVPMELAPAVAARRPTRRRVALKAALGVAAAAVLVVALAAVVRFGDEPDPVEVPSSTVPTPPPTQPPTTAPTTSAPTTPPPTTPAPTSGGMWPQATVEEVRAAQERADAGDPAYTWQVDPQLVNDDSCSPGGFTIDQPCQVELVDRFLREVLGWEAYMSPGDYSDGFAAWQYLRCAPGRTNPLYPPGPEPAPGESCAPTLDDLNYESVSFDLHQLDRQGVDGIWVVTRWSLTEPFAQADPVVAEAQATQRLEKFLAARVAGQGAEGQMVVFSNGEPSGVSTASQPDIPLLYATTSGAPFERYEIERVGAPAWPNGNMYFKVRLFADGGTTVVEQEISRVSDGGLWLFANQTTENGQPITLSHTSPDGDVTVATPSTWDILWRRSQGGPDVWFGLLSPVGPDSENESIGLVDPVAYDSWCAATGGSPVLSAPADAAAIAQQVVADPNFETTEPVAARIGGLDAVSIDVALAPGGEACEVQMIEISRWIHVLKTQPGTRLRLYLVDLPDGMSVETLAITVVAPDERFDEFIQETAPIIESITFHPRAPR
jgi:hypothetical protein